MNTTKSFLTLFAMVLLVFACQSKENESDTAEALGVGNMEDSPAKQLINEVIDAHGGEKYENIRVEFDFRNRHYITDRNNGVYQNERIFKDENGAMVRDVMTNDSFERYMNGEKTTLTEKNQAAYRNSINSVIYFTLLPYFLNDPAVKMEMLDSNTFAGVTYQKVKVTFQQEGGGKDFEDEFVYWINGQTKTMDYLAYNYLTDGGGARFRSAYNIRMVNGIRFANYVNFKPPTKRRDIENFDQLYVNDQLIELSRIENENISVTIR
ncbi:MAG: DUF6503 family protein [Bacteroidota bacterium]